MPKARTWPWERFFTPPALPTGEGAEEKIARKQERQWWFGVAVVGFLSAMILVYCLILISFARRFFALHSAIGITMAIGIMIVPLIGFWMLYQSLAAGWAHQKLAAKARKAGRDLDISGLERLPSGKVSRSAADALFAQIKEEWEENPSDWLSNYRLARAYDYAGDRPRGREIMRRAVDLEKEQRSNELKA